jgi:hypothetical protein
VYVCREKKEKTPNSGDCAGLVQGQVKVKADHEVAECWSNATKMLTTG